MRHRPTSRRLAVRLLAVVAGVGLIAALAGPAVPAHAESTDRYIVTTTSTGATDSKIKKLKSANAPIGRQFRHVLHGFSASLTDAQVAQLKSDPSVESVRKVTKVKASAVTQPDAPWGLDRIDQRSGTNGSYTYLSTGAGVTAYVVDTGIRMDHQDFDGRATSGYDFVDGDSDASDCAENYQDDETTGHVSHGSHVAGIIGGQTYGVAKQVSLVSVRVLDCDGGGWTDDVIAGLDWVAAHHPSTPSLVNLSLGGDPDEALDAAVAGLIGDGVPVVVAAGNEAADACGVTPARVPTALTVGASGTDDQQAWDFTNYGPCLDLFAPGVAITSVGTSTTTASLSLDGTSMAAPHVAGAVARYLQLNPAATPAQVSSAIVGGSSSVSNLDDGDGSPTKLLYTFVEGLSGAPKVASSRSDKNKTATVTWSAPSVAGPGRVPITGYSVAISGKTAVNVSASNRSYTFKSLKPGTTYTLTVRAKNAYGLGTAASTKQTITALPGKPKITSATKGSKGKPVTIGVKWSKPTTGGAVKNYVVTATRSGSTRTVTVSGSARSATVSGLKKNKKYTVKLRATNDSGSGSTVTWGKTVKAR